MNTPAHLLIGMAVCAKPGLDRSGRWAAAGSLLPDLSLYVLGGVSLFLLQIPPERVFGELYFSPAWQTVFAIDNSVFVWGALMAFALWRKSGLWVVFAAAGLLHIVTDFPLHHDDGRPHFWPVSGWIFESPLSYWDSNQYAGIIAPLEALAATAAAIVLARRYTGWPTRIAIAVLVAMEFWVVRQWVLFF